jgi:RNA polymerase sigma factor (sigma-70 family)
MSLAESTNGAPATARKEDDRRLAIALLAGAPGAALRAWKTFSPTVSRILRRQLGAGPDQQDLTQEVFFRLFARIRELRDQSALRTFVINISLGVAQNERRQRSRRRVRLTRTGDLPDHPVGAPDFETRQALARCDRLLDGLGREDRALFVLRQVEQAPLAEIAARLAWSRSKTKRRLARVVPRVERLIQHDLVLAEYAVKPPAENAVASAAVLPGGHGARVSIQTNTKGDLPCPAFRPSIPAASLRSASPWRPLLVEPPRASRTAPRRHARRRPPTHSWARTSTSTPTTPVPCGTFASETPTRAGS